MPQQRTDYPLDYSRGGAETAKERERGMADAATDRMKDAAESSHEIASNALRRKSGNTAKKRRQPRSSSGPRWRKALRSSPWQC